VDVARRLAPGHLVSLSGGSAAYIAIVAAIFGQTGSALWVSAAIFSGVVASVASAPGAGWIGDRLDRRRVLIGSDVAAAAVSLAMAATAKQAAALVVLIGARLSRNPRRAGVGRDATDRRAQERAGTPVVRPPPLPLPRAAAAHALRHTWRCG
jgi:MFS family permease